jgi:Conjugal transfer/entry exclusion protein
MYNPYVSSYGPDDFGFQDSPWLRQQQDAVGTPNMGGFGYTPPKPPTPPQQPSINPSPAMNPLSQLSSSRSFFQSDIPPSPVGDTMSGAPSPENLDPPESPLMTAYKKLLSQPEGAAHSAYTDYLKRGYPKESQYEPSKWRSLLGMATSGLLAYSRDPNAIAKGEAITDEPYRRAIAQYGQEGTRLYQAANEEDRQQQNDLRNVAGMVTEQRNAATAEHQRRQDATALMNEKRKEAHDAIYEKIHSMPDYIPIKQPGGNVWLVNKHNGADKIDTGIESRIMDKQTEMALGFAYSMQEIKERGAQATATGVAIKGTAPGESVNPTPNWQLHQPLDEEGKPQGPVVEYNTKTGEIRDAPNFKGNLKPPPKPPTTQVEIHTESTRETPAEEQGLIGRTLSSMAPGFFPPPKPKDVTTTTTRKPVTPPSKKSLANEGKTKTNVPDSAATPTGVKNIPDTTEASAGTRYEDADGTYIVQDKDYESFHHSRPNAKKSQDQSNIKKKK